MHHFQARLITIFVAKDKTWIRAKVSEDIFKDGVVDEDLVLAQTKAARHSKIKESIEA